MASVSDTHVVGDSGHTADHDLISSIFQVAPIQTTNYSMGPLDAFVLVNAAVTITLPAPSSALLGKRYTVKKIGATGNVTIQPGGATPGTIDGASTATLTVQYSSLDLFTDGANWWSV